MTMNKEEALQALKAQLVPSILSQHPKGFPFEVPSVVTPQCLEELASLPLEPSDVWIVTYPKTGTTWTQNIVKLLRNKGIKDGIDLQQSIPYVETNNEKRVSTFAKILKPEGSKIPLVTVDLTAMPKPRAFKTHMPYYAMPCGEPHTTPCKYIYVTRNPKDAALSLYFHYDRNYIKWDANLDWDVFFYNYVYGNMMYGNFFDHVLSWWPHRNDRNVLFLTYENMKRDPQAAVVQIAEFIGADVTDEVIDKVVTETSFKRMKKDDKANHLLLDTIGKPGSLPFMRKGEVGDWKNHFTPEQSAEIDKLCQDRLKDTGLVFDFGE